MVIDIIRDIAIDELMQSPAGEWLEKAVEKISDVQRVVLAFSEKEEDDKLTLLKIGTVFHIFLVDTLASGKKVKDLKEDDWKSIADKVAQYAVLTDEQSYTEFVFKLYADYIELSSQSLRAGKIPKEKVDEVRTLAGEIRRNTDRLHSGELSEADYVENCLWTSLEAMIKCLSMSLTSLIGPEFAQLAQATSQLAFEYGRYVLYAREQAILKAYIENQYILDDQLQKEYEAYLEEVEKHAERFGNMVENAFSLDLHEALIESAELARAAGVKEEELLTSIEDIDDYFS